MATSKPATRPITAARDLGLVIRARRRDLALNQQMLADKVGVSRQWLIEIERGKPRAEVALILRTLAALDLRLFVDTGAAHDVQDPTPAAVDLRSILDRARDLL